jgi:hypothetical protein
MRATIGLLIVAALLVISSTGVVLAGKGDRKADKKGEPTAPPAVIGSVSGDRIKMAQARVADHVTRISDAAGDQVLADGSPAPEAEAWSDIASVHVAPIKVPRKLLTKMDEDFPRGAVGAFYGKDARWSELDRAVFVAVELAGKRPSGSVVQQVEVGLDGETASPVQVGAAADTRAGLERFSLSGLFRDGSESSGTTDVSGRQPGDAIDFYNAESGVFGFYESRQHTYFLIMPLERDAQSVAVTLRSGTPAGEVIDRLELPGGGSLIPLADPALGWDAAQGTAPLACRALETFSQTSGLAGLDEPDSTRIRYSAGVDPLLDAEAAGAELAALDAYGGTLPVTLLPLHPDGEPRTVDAQLSRAPALNAFTLTMDVPPGQWSFQAVDDDQLRTPAGERLIDPGTLTGRAGVRTGEGQDGFVSGDPDCARFDLGAEACAFVPADAMAALVGLDASDVEQEVVARADGAQWCVGKASASGEVQYIARFGTGYSSAARFEQDVAAQPCEVHAVDLGAQGVNLDCGAQGFENHTFRVLPDAIAEADPDGGLLVSVDMLVDPGKPHGERYDGQAAEALLGGMVDAVAASAAPAGVE